MTGGHAAHAPEAFQLRARRVAAAADAAWATWRALEDRPPRTAAKLQRRMLQDLARRVMALLEEAEAYAPAGPGPAVPPA